MRDIICFEHIRHMATIIRAKEVLDKNQDLVFGKFLKILRIIKSLQIQI